MKKTTKIIIALVVVAAVALGAILLTNKKEPAGENSGSQSNSGAVTKTITYTDSGFSPAQITVSPGDSITFVNQSEAEIEPSSNPHPVHTDNPQLNAGDVEPGDSKTITVTTKGTWGYHNHYASDKRGTIIVE